VTASAALFVAPTVAPTAAPVANGDGSARQTALPDVNSAIRERVLTGNFRRPTGTKLEVECGAKFLRLRRAGGERLATPD
jgi:hypothetical protein